MEIVNSGPAIQTAAGSIPILFLHGFPGIRSRQNRDIAETVAAATNRPTQLLLYSGLGHASGVFRFQGCHREVLAHVAGLVSRGVRELDVVGHSWGGYLALAVSHELMQTSAARVRRLVLMSPLLDFATPEQWGPQFGSTIRDNPELSFPPQDELTRDFVAMRDTIAPATLVEAVPAETETLLLQAADDQVTPPIVARAMLPRFKRKPIFELVQTDHSFVIDRERISPRIARFLNDGQ